MDRTQAAVFGLRVGHALAGEVWKAVCEDIVEQTSVSRASVWAFADGREKLVCLNLFGAARREHAGGMVLLHDGYPDYFRAITNNSRVVASDALNQPATRCFAGTHFKGNDVRSLLDYIVLYENVVVGVLCCEQSAAMLIGTVFLAVADG